MNQPGKRIKICGLSRREDILSVNKWKPDYIGFVFAPGKRRVTPSQAASLKELLSPGILAVGVFVNAPMEEIISLARRRVIDLIQLHGEEDEGYILTLKEKLGGDSSIIKAIRVQTAQDVENAKKIPADFLLFDTYTKGLYGGSGKTFDWSFLPQGKRPWFLAGGISISNVRDAMKTHAFCLDVSSSLETEGKKDPEKIKEIIQIIRSESLCQKEDLDSTEDNLFPKR